ncbi:MAG: substrate-binding periplasmic protein, partial [Thermoanaerobaculia bacterium]
MRRTGAFAIAAILLLGGAGCDAMPRDPEKTLESVRGGTMDVGVTENPPWVRRGAGGEAVGVEPALVRELAGALGAEIDWVWGNSEEHLDALKRFELDLVIGGITQDTPWRHHVGFARPWVEMPWVVALPPGHPRIESIEGIPVGWSTSPAIAAILAERGATPVEIADPAAFDGPVAVPLWWVESRGWTHSGIVLRRAKHTVGLPPGENRWIMT